MAIELRDKEIPKWTTYPHEYLEQIQTTFHEFFSDYELNDYQFVVKGLVSSKELMVSAGLNHKNEIRQHNLLASMDFDPEKDQMKDKTHLLIDLLAQMWQEHLEDERDPSELPADWTAYPWENKNLFYRYDSTNTELEAQANSLLNIEEDSLVNEVETVPNA